MAYVAKKLAQSRLNNTTETTLYTTPTGITTIIKDIVVCNTTNAAAVYSLSVVPTGGTAGDDNRIAKAVSVAANTTVLVQLGTVMNAGDFISFLEGTANAIAVTISGVEFDTVGRMASATVTANQGSITTETDLTSVTVTATLSSGRRYKLSMISEVQSTISSDEATFRMKEGGTTLKEVRNTLVGANKNYFAEGWVEIAAPSSGSHTYKVSLQRTVGTGTLTMNASTTNPTTLLLEDIGGA